MWLSAPSLRAMNPPQQAHKNIAHHFNICDAHSNISSRSQVAPDKTKSLDEESSRTQLSRKGAVHQTVIATLDSTHDNMPHSTSSIARSSNTCSNARSSNDLPSSIISIARWIRSQSIPQALPTNLDAATMRISGAPTFSTTTIAIATSNSTTATATSNGATTANTTTINTTTTNTHDTKTTYATASTIDTPRRISTTDRLVITTKKKNTIARTIQKWITC